MMRIVVTGAAGRLGTPVVARLHQLGHDVLASDRIPACLIPTTRWRGPSWPSAC